MSWSSPPLFIARALSYYAMAGILWMLLVVLVTRFVGETLVAFAIGPVIAPTFLWLLAFKLMVVAVMVKVCVDITRDCGFFAETAAYFAAYLIRFGWIYLGV